MASESRRSCLGVVRVFSADKNKCLTTHAPDGAAPWAHGPRPPGAPPAGAAAAAACRRCSGRRRGTRAAAPAARRRAARGRAACVPRIGQSGIGHGPELLLRRGRHCASGGTSTPRPHGASPPWAKRRPQRKAKRAGAREATRCEHAPRCSAASSSVRRACLQEVESGESSTLWRPEARCGGHCRLSSGSGWTLGCVGAAVALGGIRWAEEEASPIRAEGPFNQLACCGEASCWWYVPCALPRATGSKSA